VCAAATSKNICYYSALMHSRCHGIAFNLEQTMDALLYESIGPGITRCRNGQRACAEWAISCKLWSLNRSLIRSMFLIIGEVQYHHSILSRFRYHLVGMGIVYCCMHRLINFATCRQPLCAEFHRRSKMHCLRIIFVWELRDFPHFY